MVYSSRKRSGPGGLGICKRDHERISVEEWVGMLVRDMSREECEDLLARLGFGRLGCTRNNQPYVVPIYFVSEPGCLYGFSTMGEKIESMRLNPLVCVEADEVPDPIEWASVVVRGRYEEFPTPPSIRSGDRKRNRC